MHAHQGLVVRRKGDVALQVLHMFVRVGAPQILCRYPCSTTRGLTDLQHVSVHPGLHCG